MWSLWARPKVITEAGNNIKQMIIKADDFYVVNIVNGTLKFDHIKRLITLTSGYIKPLYCSSKLAT